MLSRTFRVALVGSALALAATSASASGGSGGLPPNGYDYKLQSYTYVGTLKYGTNSVTYSSPQVYAPLVNADAALYNFLDSEAQSLNSKIPTLLQPALSAFGYDSAYQSSTISISGPLTMSVQPGGGVSLSGLKLYGSINITARYGLLSGTCNANGSAQPTVSANLDIPSGDIIGATIVANTGQVGVSYHCSTNIGAVVPFFDPIINWILSDLFPVNELDSLLSFRNYSFNTSGASGAFAGLSQAIPAKQFVFNGVDKGAYLAANIASLLANDGASITFYPVQPIGYMTDMYAGPSYVVTTFNQNLFSLSIPKANLTFSLVDSQTYNTFWHCNQGTACGVIP